MGTINIYSSNGANKAGLIYNGSGDITVDTEHLANTSSSVQSQLDARLPLAGGTLTGDLIINTSSNGMLKLQEGGNDKGYIGAGGGGLYIKNLAGDVIFRNSSDADTIRIKDSGNVGIGTTSPSFGAGGFGLELAGAAGAGRPTIRVKDTVTSNALQLSATATAAILESRSAGMDLVLGTSGAEKFRIDDTSGYLVAQHQAQVRLVLGSVGNSNNNTSNWIRGNQSYLQYNSAASGHTWEINGAEKMRIHSDGNVGIGTNSPNAKLTINADTGDLPALVLGNVDSGGIAYVHRNNRYLTSNGSNWIVDGRDPIAVIATDSNATTKFPSTGLVMHNESQTDNTFSTPIMFGNRSNSGAYNTAYAYIAGRKTGQGVDSNWSTGEIWIDTAGTKHNGNNAYMDHSPAIKIRNTGTVDMRWQPFSYGTFAGSNLNNGVGWSMSPLVTQGLSYNNNASHGYGLTVAEPGYYLCYGTSLYSPGGGLSYVYIGWCINGSQQHHWHSNHTISSNHDWVSSIIRWCNAGDHITLENSSANVTSQWGGTHSQYYVWKVG